MANESSDNLVKSILENIESAGKMIKTMSKNFDEISFEIEAQLEIDELKERLRNTENYEVKHLRKTLKEAAENAKHVADECEKASAEIQAALDKKAKKEMR
ncbi:hypothetical protein CTI12_AA386810 [Artemisia annua]|uniref:Uncharacterized protein n=1 Tax=Artemisia annua TaxID=35608 RepID=A0A2U1MFA1_ARTAN|nr:hypothetical protein CTI12_AA386810 [Artemisia annua]